MKKIVFGLMLSLAIFAGSAAVHAETAVSQKVSFMSTLSVGSSGAAVTALQQLLVAKGFLTASPTGYYGGMTKAAVIAYQKANGLDAVGFLGPKTRARLNAEMTSGGTVATTSVTPSTTCTPSVTVLSPNGGETYAAGQVVNVTWTSCGLPTADLVNINLMRLDASTGNYVHIATTPDASNTFPLSAGTAAITVSATGVWPTTVQYGNVYKVLIDVVQPSSRDAGHVDAQDWSDATFTINAGGGLSALCAITAPQAITVLSPNGGENLATGTPVTVTWSSCNIQSTATLKLMLSVSAPDGSHSVSIPVMDTLNTGSAAFTLTSTMVSSLGGVGSNFKASVSLPSVYSGSTLVTGAVSDASDAYFSVH
jgi:peptidoglycan hydrolase-like protein with peptidoglycan-binding domain